MSNYLGVEGPPEVSSSISLIGSKQAWLDWVAQCYVQLSLESLQVEDPITSPYEHPVWVFAHACGKYLLVLDELASRNRLFHPSVQWPLFLFS